MSIEGTDRAYRVSSVIHRQLASILLEKISDPRILPVTITEVVVSRDLKHAKVYTTNTDPDGQLEATVENLNRAKGYIRSLLSKQVQLKYIPTLSFMPDQMHERGNRVLSLIRESSD